MAPTDSVERSCPASRQTPSRLERQAQALELRRAGNAYHKIGAAMGIGTTTAFKLVQKGLWSSIQHLASDVRAQELDRIERHLARLVRRVELGDVQAIKAAARLFSQRASLMARPDHEATPEPQDGEENKEPAAPQALPPFPMPSATPC